MKPIKKINTFKILHSMFLPKSAISLSKEAVNTLQELGKEEVRQYCSTSDVALCILHSNTVWVYLD